MRITTTIESLPGIYRAYLFLLLSMGLALLTVNAQAGERSGKEVVDSVCAACHATGAQGAPKIGDQDAWHSRASQGLSSLTLHALNGIRNMPAHGGDKQLSDLEIARAVTYMVNQSGGNWIEPASAAELTKVRSGEQVVKTECAKCHAEGVGGAPKIGDKQAWIKRMELGLPYLVSSAIHGHGGMPSRGGQANLTDVELRSAILYMYYPAGITTEAKSTAKQDTGVTTDPNHKIVDGIDIYLGIVRAEHLHELPKDSPERSMHGGIPKGSGYYHLNVSLFDEKSHAPITDAQVQMHFNWPGLSSPPIELEPMLMGGSFGQYVKPQPGTLYVINLSIKRPESRTVETKFQHKF